MRAFLEVIGNLLLAVFVSAIFAALAISVAHSQTLSCQYQQQAVTISYGNFQQRTIVRFFVPHVTHVRASCNFTHNVEHAAIKYVWLAGGQGDGDFFTRAYSPVLHRWYSVHCQGNGSLRDAYPNGSGMAFDCRAGTATIKFHAWS